MKKITINLSAHSLPAGKYDEEVPPLYGNEDNFYVYDTTNKTALALDSPSEDDYNATVRDGGIVLAVADGMGGTNAGEVASEIAIRVVQERFNAGVSLAPIAASHKKRMRYMEETIVMADKAIKRHAKEHTECEGMGSTLIIAWIVGGEMTVSWCGDSRCYCFSPDDGLSMVSHDHSYVQELADKHVITYEQTFGHPQGNIITRSLGDHNSAARPESVLHYVADGDIVLLCSDGLSGVLFDYAAWDKEGDLLSEENIEAVVRANQDSMSQCSQELFAAAERADWYDNVTVLLCKICSGAKKVEHKSPRKKRRGILWLCTAAVAIVGILVLCFASRNSPTAPSDVTQGEEKPSPTTTAAADTTARDSSNFKNELEEIISDAKKNAEKKAARGTEKNLLKIMDSVINSTKSDPKDTAISKNREIRQAVEEKKTE